MKKTLLIVAIMLLAVKAYSQAPTIVNDPTNYVQLLNLVKTGAEQTQKVNQQVEFLKQQKENLERVNSYIKKANTVNKAVNQSKDIINNLNEKTSALRSFNNLSPEYMSKVSTELSGYYHSVTEHVTTITSYLSDGKYKMSDAERLQLVNDELDKMKMVNNNINKTFRSASKINNMRNTIGRKK